jgi:cytochrome c oxidase subunit 2
MNAILADNFRLFPPQASTGATEVDHLFFFVLAVSAFFALLICILVVFFAVRYRRRSPDEFPTANVQNTKLEITWCVVPFLIMIVMFVWGTNLYAKMKRPPENAITINVIGKQWMWKVQHPEGNREIDALHVPVGVPIRLIMGSQDVIHSFYIPAFRMKQDVVPGIFSTQWFTATKPGRYHIFCAQYCGAEHAKMIGEVVVMDPADYAAWLAGTPRDISPAAAGRQLFESWGCAACHGQRAPTMAGLYLSAVPLDNGSTVTADDDYLRESIIEPAAKVVAGYPPIMPSYRGQLSEEQLMALVAYIKSQGASAAPGAPNVAGGAPASTQPADRVRLTPATQPVNGQSPDRLGNFPPARQPPEISPPRP